MLRTLIPVALWLALCVPAGLQAAEPASLIREASPGTPPHAKTLEAMSRSLAAAIAADDCEAVADAAAWRAAADADPAVLGAAWASRPRLHAASGPACERALRLALRELRLAADRAGLHALPAPQPKMAELLRGIDGFAFRPGDVVLLRNAAPVSASVAQVGELPTFFSHAAVIGYDPLWKRLEVVESVVGEGLRTVPLQDWLSRLGFVRMAVYRMDDAALAQRAAQAAVGDAGSREEDQMLYDFALSLADSQLLYCTEVVTLAYRLADARAPRVPMHLSKVGTLLQTFPLAPLGVTSPEIFLPDDLELDPRFERVLELSNHAAIPVSEALDREFRELYDGLRGERREAVLAEIDRHVPRGPVALTYLFGGQYFAYRALPEASRARIAGMAKLVAERVAAAPEPAAAP